MNIPKKCFSFAYVLYTIYEALETDVIHHAIRSLSYDRSVASTKLNSPHSAA